MASKNYVPTAATKVLAIVVEILFWLALVSVAISVILVAVVNFTSFHVKYTRAPLQVWYLSTGGGSQVGQYLDSGDPRVVGFSRLIMGHDKKGLQGIFVLMPFFLALLLFSVMMILRKITRSIRRGTPFTVENAARIRALGWLVIAAGPFYGLLEYIYAMMLLPQVSIEGAAVKANPDAHGFYILAGLIILVIGHVFRHGVELRIDSELTV
jgi:hypothetical protein